jgi:hypothetical protein
LSYSKVILTSYLDVEITLQPFWKGESQGKEYAGYRKREVALDDPAAPAHLVPLSKSEDCSAEGYEK